MNTNEDLREFIRKMPKVELHLHLEGAFTLETLFRLISKYGGDPSIRSLDDVQRRFSYPDFPAFIETWKWKNCFFREGKDFEAATYETLAFLRRQNVVYVEAFLSPWDYAANGIHMEEITESVIAGCERASTDFGIGWKLILDLNRDLGPETAMSRLDQAVAYQQRGVIGIGLGGSEQQFPPAPFAPIFREARAKGFFVVAHAGEAAGPSSIWSAIDKLGAQRIGHGVRAKEDSALVRLLREQEIPLEICVTSNVMTRVVRSVEEHPIKYYFDSGLFVTVNSDDPTMFGSTLTGEYLLLFDKLGFSIEHIKKISMNAVDASFLPLNEKNSLREQFLHAWQSL